MLSILMEEIHSNPVSDLNILNQFVDIQFDDSEPSSETYDTNQQG